MDQIGLVTFIVAVLLPPVVGLITKQSWNSHIKALVLAAFAGGTTVGDAVISGTELLVWPDTLYQWLFSWGLAVLAHYQVWKPSGVTARVQSAGIRDITPSTA